jgi:hypothetical protein
VRDLVFSYYYVLRSILRDRPELRRCLSRCRHCGIYFLTHPRNAKRTDLGCPFGCREAYRKQSSTERSVAYYRTSEGRLKRRLQNERRRGAVPSSEVGKQEREKEQRSQEEMSRGSASGLGLEMVMYLAMVTSLVEGRRVSREEIEELVARIMKQHSIARRRRMDYVVWELNKKPP